MLPKLKTTAKKLKLLSLTLLLCALTFALYPSTTNAQSSTPSAATVPTTHYQLPTTIPPTSPLYTDLLVNNLFHTFSCLAIGQSLIGQPCLTYQMTKNAQGMVQGIPVLSSINTSGGALGGVTSVIGMLYQNPPVRTADYLASVGQGLGIVKEAHAQGVGGSGAAVLNPILKLWQVSRNISYVILILIFLVIGLMVMFRNKINPQTVITAQTALPGLVIGLILITFSYFLAGLITDVAFLTINLIGFYFSTSQSPLPAGTANCPNPSDLLNCIKDQNVVSIFSKFIGVVNGPDGTVHLANIIFNNASANVQNFLRLAIGLMTFNYSNQIGHAVPFVGDLAGIVTGLIGVGIAAGRTPELVGMVLSWAAMVILIYSMLKLLLRLINNYLTIIFLTLTAPFQFLAASLPGRQGLATNWMLNMLANILAFPAVLAVFYFVAYLITGTFNKTLDNSPFIINPGNAALISSKTLPLLGGLDIPFINLLLAFGALIALPAVPDIINRSVGKMGAAGQLLGQEISGNVQGGRGYSNQGQLLGQGVSKIGQDYDTFRGKPVGWAPSVGSRFGVRVANWAPFGGKWKPFEPRGSKIS